MENIIIFGIGQNADIIFYQLSKYTKYRVVAFCVDKSYFKDKIHLNLPVYIFEEVEKNFDPKKYKFIAPVSHNKKDNFGKEVYRRIKKKKYEFISYISPLAIVDTKEVGENTIILEQNNIQPYSKIGNNCLIWSGNHIGHHSIIEDNCFISSHVVISGSVLIKENTYIGVNSTLRDNIKIGKNSIIGAHSLVLEDIVDNTIMKAEQSRSVVLKKRRNVKI